MSGYQPDPKSERRFALILIGIVLSILAIASALGVRGPHEAFPRIELGE